MTYQKRVYHSIHVGSPIGHFGIPDCRIENPHDSPSFGYHEVGHILSGRILWAGVSYDPGSPLLERKMIGMDSQREDSQKEDFQILVDSVLEDEVEGTFREFLHFFHSLTQSPELNLYLFHFHYHISIISTVKKKSFFVSCFLFILFLLVCQVFMFG